MVAGGGTAAAASKPPTFESVVAGDGYNRDSATGLAVSAADTLYGCGYIRHDATGYDITVTCYADAPDGWSRTWNSPANEDDAAWDIAVATGDLLWKSSEHGYGLPRQLVVDRLGRVFTCSTTDDGEGDTLIVLTA